MSYIVTVLLPQIPMMKYVRGEGNGRQIHVSGYTTFICNNGSKVMQTKEQVMDSVHP
jgi:hypothetical protein